jgi:hypothetical protein
MGIEGFRNYATWRIDFWMKQQENHDRQQAFLGRLGDDSELTPHDCRTFVSQMVLDEWLPDLDSQPGRRWSDIDWRQLAASWQPPRKPK